MKKFFIRHKLGLFLIAALILLAACSNEAREEEQRQDEEARLLADIETTLRGVIDRSETIDSIEVLSRETDEEEGIDLVSCRVNTNDGELSYIKYYDVQYRLFKNEEEKTEEWVLDFVNPAREDTWAVAPITGAKPDVIENAIAEASIRVGDEEWGLPSNDTSEPTQQAEILDFAAILGSIFGLSTSSSSSASQEIDVKATIGNVEIVSQDTQLSNKRDSAIVAVMLESDVLIAEGEMEVNLVFDDETLSWVATDYRVHTPFVSSYKEDRELVLSDDELISVIDRKKFEFSSSLTQSEQDRLVEDATLAIVGKLTGFPIGTLLGQSTARDAQEITIRAEDISNFTVKETSVAAKGSFNAYTCEFTLDKGIIQFAVAAVIAYQYDSVNGWGFKDVTFISRVESFNPEAMLGRWTGQALTYIGLFNRNPQLIIDFTDISGEGNVMATIHFPSIPATAVMSGWFNHNDLSLSLQFSEWIQTPPGRGGIGSPNEAIESQGTGGYNWDIDKVVLDIESNTLSQSYVLTVTKLDESAELEVDEAEEADETGEDETDEADESDETGG